ncbi:MAG: ABC transporter ATP-binding protein [Candidatus Paracaedibacteraceae bacterium]|nr:ABC transporter ATP-binding protein [Candidatus Paracaedibacteraceae bacterium]
MLSLSLSHMFGDTNVLRDINLNFSKGSFTAIIGPNGAGKSTLLKMCAGVLKPSQGTVKLKAGIKRAYLPQHNQLDRHFPISVHDVIAMGFWPKIGLYNRLTQIDKNRLAHALAMVGLEGLEDSPISVLSGGQFQRLLFARLWLQEADLLILDEPFSAVDQPTTEDLLALLQNWILEGKTIITVIHQLPLAEHYIPQSILLNRSVIAKGPSKEILKDAALIRKAYVA